VAASASNPCPRVVFDLVLGGPPPLSIPPVSSQPSFNMPFQHAPFSIAFLSFSFNMTFDDFQFSLLCTMFCSSLFLIRAVCTLLHGVLSSEKRFWPLFFQNIFAVCLSKAASHCCRVFLATILQVDHRLCLHFLSDFCVRRHLLRFHVAPVQHVLHPPSS
jgi:hypothetical protein